MAPSVTIDEETRERLEAIQRSIERETGRNVPLSLVLRDVVRHTIDTQREMVIEDFRDDTDEDVSEER